LFEYGRQTAKDQDEMKTYYWDFFGADAEPTAEHFLRHLDEFIVVNGFAGCTTGLSSDSDNHRAVWCRTGPEWERQVEKTLAPKRCVEE
jgi:hypothetical protein